MCDFSIILTLEEIMTFILNLEEIMSPSILLNKKNTNFKRIVRSFHQKN